IITIDGLTAVIDRTNDAVGKLQQDNRGIYIARCANGRVNHNASCSENLFHFTPNQITGHIEVMNRHIKENATGDPDIFNRWWTGVTTDNMKQVGATNLSLLYC